MRKRLLSILLLCCMVLTLLPTAAFAAGDVDINETNFPDANFRQYVKDEFDKDKSDTLSADEIAAVKDIRPAHRDISSLTGVEHFTNLERLNVQDNEKLTTLDLSKNTALVSLLCSNTNLTSLDTSHNTKLVFLECNEVSTLTSLNVSRNTELKQLSCRDNALTALDLTNNTALEKLDCGGNEFTTLDLSKNTSLKYFGFFNGKLSSLDLTNNTNLEELYFCGNNFSTIDVSKNTSLRILRLFGNQLITLDTSKNSTLQELWVYTNPLTSMNLGDSGSTMEVEFNNKPYPITVSTATKTFNLSTLPAGFDVRKASSWSGGAVNGNTLTVDEGIDKVTYTYDCGERQATYGNPETTGKLMMPCTLQINWENAPDALTGTVNIIGELKYGKKIYFDVDNSNESGGLRCKWYREDKADPIGTAIEYELVEADIGKKITCVVSGTTKPGTIQTTVGPVEKADGPAAPVISLRTRTSTDIKVTENNAWEYSIDNGATWQSSCHFTNLQPGTEYTIIARVKETATHKPSRNSAPLNVTTMHLDISEELKGKLRAVVSAYKAEYDGKEHEAVIVDTPKLPTDWTIAGYTTDGGISYGNSISKIKDAGTLNVGVKFVHPDYMMNITHYYTAEVTPKPLTADMIADIPSQHYTGNSIQPTPEIKDGDMVLMEGTDFTYSYDTNTSPEQGGKVTITGKGNYKDTASKNFSIVNEITEITEDDLKDLEIPTLVTVKCTTANSSKEYGRISGGFDLSKKPYMENGVWKAIVKLNLSVYKGKYDADTKITHEYAGLEGNPHAAFTLKYVNGKWELDGTFPNVIILVKCYGQHPQTPPYPTEENVSGLEQVQVRVQCSTDRTQFKNYGILPGSVSIMPDANDPSQATLTLIPSVYSKQYTIDTGITHSVAPNQATDNLKIQMRYNSAEGKWMPAGELTPLVIYVKCNNHQGERYTITFNGNGGTPSVTRMTTIDQKLPELPTATHSGSYSFDGWYTAASGGTKITTAYVFSANTTAYAHWTYTGGGGGWYYTYYTYYTIKATAGTNGSISPSGWTSVRHGWDQTFTITPDKGYAVAKVLVDGKSVGSVKSYTFKNVTKDHTIEVVFVKGTASPSTGDSSNLPLWSALLLASTLTLAGTVHYKRKRAR